MQRNRSERRAILRAEAKQLKKEGKKLNKGNKFNSKKSNRPIEYRKYKDSLFPISDSTDTFTVEYIHLAPEYDDSQEGESDLEDAGPKKIDVIHIEESLSLADTDTRSIHSHKSRRKLKPIQPLVLTGPEEEGGTQSEKRAAESGVGCDGSEDQNQCTFLSLSEEDPIKENVKDLIKEIVPSIVSSSVSTLSVVEQKSEIVHPKTQSVYNHDLPFLSGETLKPSKKKNVFYRMFKKKSEKILDKLSSIKVVEEKKTKKPWKLWKKLSLPNTA
ncbi:hypothetical protein BY458DRAFT_527301 [Sporodiniella umbellata]|nr:hypothetical protein BY458DRAFT_527301 [Sporodiniella umbellata]